MNVENLPLLGYLITTALLLVSLFEQRTMELTASGRARTGAAWATIGASVVTLALSSLAASSLMWVVVAIALICVAAVNLYVLTGRTAPAVEAARVKAQRADLEKEVGEWVASLTGLLDLAALSGYVDERTRLQFREIGHQVSQCLLARLEPTIDQDRWSEIFVPQIVDHLTGACTLLFDVANAYTGQLTFNAVVADAFAWQARTCDEIQDAQRRFHATYGGHREAAPMAVT